MVEERCPAVVVVCLAVDVTVVVVGAVVVVVVRLADTVGTEIVILVLRDWYDDPSASTHDPVS